MRKKIGCLLIILSLSLLLFIYYPVIQLYFFPISNPPIQSGFFIEIPKIRAFAPVIENVDANSQADYKKALQKGVASAKGFALPGQPGTVFLFAHSSLPPWEMTRQNTAFLRLGELQAGDQIKITKDGKEFLYSVTRKIEVWPGEAQQLQGANQLVLQTCIPPGTALKRLLVFASPTN